MPLSKVLFKVNRPRCPSVRQPPQTTGSSFGIFSASGGDVTPFDDTSTRKSFLEVVCIKRLFGAKKAKCLTPRSFSSKNRLVTSSPEAASQADTESAPQP